MAAPAPASAPPPPLAAACVVGASTGIAAADAMTAAGLVCEALRQAGAHVDDHPVPASSVAPGSSAYRVELHPLGHIMILQVAYESPLLTTRDSRSLQLTKLEEIPVAAPRLAESLVTGKPLAQTARVDTLVGQETRRYPKKYGEVKVGIGVLGFLVPDSDLVGGYGVHGQLYYETVDYSVGAEARIGGSDSSSGDGALVGLSLGARYFLTETDIAPFVGGGLGVLWLSFDEESQRRYRGAGLAARGELGIEFLRLHEVRFDLLLRVDAPLYRLHASGDYHRYALPLSIMGAYSFE